MNLAPTEIDPCRPMISETLGRAPAARACRAATWSWSARVSATFPTRRRRSATAARSRCWPRARAPRLPASTCPKPPWPDRGDIAREGGTRLRRGGRRARGGAIAPLVPRCAERLGGLDGLVLNVGISRGLPLARDRAETWDDEFAVNLRSHMLFAQAALPLMARGRRDRADLVAGGAAQRRPQSGLRIVEGGAGVARARHRGGRRDQGDPLQRGAARPDRHADGPRRDPAAPQPRARGAVRPPGHRLGGRPTPASS